MARSWAQRQFACGCCVPLQEEPTLRYSNTVTKGTRSSRPEVSRLSTRAALSLLLELAAAAVETD
jgi:hypothetical protein